jgi:hypothetical protein
LTDGIFCDIINSIELRKFNGGFGMKVVLKTALALICFFAVTAAAVARGKTDETPIGDPSGFKETIDINDKKKRKV